MMLAMVTKTMHVLLKLAKRTIIFPNFDLQVTCVIRLDVEGKTIYPSFDIQVTCVVDIC
jgi:hypothetical protein